MLKKKSGGFTLIEVTIVLAITAAMVAIIYSGQRSIRTEAEFSDTMNLIVADMEAVRNAAQTSNDSDLTYAQSNGTTNQTPTGATDMNGTSNVIWGKLIEGSYTSGSNTYLVVTDLVANVNGQQTADCGVIAGSENISRGASYKINLPYGITVGGKNVSKEVIVFHRQLCGGQLQTYNFSQNNIGSSNTPALDPTVAANYYATSAYYENPPYGCINPNTGVDPATGLPYNSLNDPNPLAGHCYVNPRIGSIQLTDPYGRQGTIKINGNQGNSITGTVH